MAQALRLQGIISPILTPFDENGEIKANSIPKIVDSQAPHVRGFFVCGSFSSGMMMKIEERKRVLELVTAANQKHNKTLIAHIGTTSTKSCLELTRHAQQTGAHAVAALVPYYYPHNDQAILHHFGAIVDATDLPVYFYDYPEYTGRKVDVTLLQKMADLGVVGVKDTTGGIQTMRARLPVLPLQSFDYMIGSESLLAAAFRLGVRACISGLSNVFPEIVTALYQALIEQDQQEIQILEAQITRIRQLLRIGPKMEATYAALVMRGVDCGKPRLPFANLDEEIFQKLRQGLADLDVL